MSERDSMNTLWVIKPLEWEGGGYQPWYAKVSFGWFVIYWHTDPKIRPRLVMQRSKREDAKIMWELGRYDDVDAAKEAADRWNETNAASSLVKASDDQILGKAVEIQSRRVLAGED